MNLETQKSKTWGKTADDFIIDQFAVDEQGQIDGSRIVGFYGSQDGAAITSLGLVIFNPQCAYVPVNGSVQVEEEAKDDDKSDDGGSDVLVFSSRSDGEAEEEEVNPGNIFPKIPLDVQYIIFFVLFNLAMMLLVIGCCVCIWRCQEDSDQVKSQREEKRIRKKIEEEMRQQNIAVELAERESKDVEQGQDHTFEAQHSKNIDIEEEK